MSRIIVVDRNEAALQSLTRTLEAAGYEFLVMERVAEENGSPEPFRPQKLKELERRHIEATLRHFEGNRREAARALGISERTLRSRLKAWAG